MDKPRSYYAFEMLYWTGIREGELLALTPADFDFEKQTVRINKTYHRMKKQEENEELLQTIQMVAVTLNGMKEEPHHVESPEHS